ncbi:MAG: glycerol-3-phosphate acyltransferase [Bacillota bacterium]
MFVTSEPAAATSAGGPLLVIMILVGAYLLGSFPSAFLMTAIFKKADIRTIGSGNVGGMNTARNVGLVPGLLTGALDLGKGVLATYLAMRLAPGTYLPMWAAAACVAGHNWMVFIGFKGGKGLGVTIGALLLLAPWALLPAAGVVVLGTILLKNSYAGTVAGVLSIPISLWFLKQDVNWVLPGVALAAVIVAKHLPDLKRFATGKKEVL